MFVLRNFPKSTLIVRQFEMGGAIFFIVNRVEYIRIKGVFLLHSGRSDIFF